MGYLRARRSIKLGPGVKLNVNKRSLGLTAGTRGAHYSVNSKGTRTRTVGLPGTGLSYVDRSGGRSKGSRRTKSPAGSRTAAKRVAAKPAAPPKAQHPGLLARHYERAFYEGTKKLAAGDAAAALDAFRDADESDDKHRAISPALFVGVLVSELGDRAAAIPYLERVTQSGQALPDKLMAKYCPNAGITVTRGSDIEFPVSLGSFAATMILAECYRDTGRIQEGIGILQKLHDEAPSPPTLALLCDIYAAAEEWDEIVHVAAGVSNDDDTTLTIKLLQAQAMAKQGLPDAALAAYREALRSTKREKSLLREARYERAKLYQELGKKAMAKRDLGRLYGEDPDYRDVAALLRQLA